MNEYDDGPALVYLLHYEIPYPGGRWPRHYLGWTVNLDRRLWQHRTGRGAALTALFASFGIEFEVARTWQGGPDLERRLKRRHAPVRLCPFCREERHAAVR